MAVGISDVGTLHRNCCSGAVVFDPANLQTAAH